MAQAKSKPKPKKKAVKKTTKATPKKGVDANIKKWGKGTHSNGWTYVPNLLLEHQAKLGITPVQLNIILTIMKHWWERDKLPWPSVNHVGEQVGRSRSVVQRRIRELENMGYIKRIYNKDPSKEKMNLNNEYDFSGLVAALTKIAKEKQELN